jgi:hypothetical protein
MALPLLIPFAAAGGGYVAGRVIGWFDDDTPSVVQWAILSFAVYGAYQMYRRM